MRCDVFALYTKGALFGDTEIRGTIAGTKRAARKRGTKDLSCFKLPRVGEHHGRCLVYREMVAEEGNRHTRRVSWSGVVANHNHKIKLQVTKLLF
jgi:hypothetical protein